MSLGEKYWTVYCNSRTHYVQVIQATWYGDFVDMRREREGRIFSTKVEAEQWLVHNPCV